MTAKNVNTTMNAFTVIVEVTGLRKHVLMAVWVNLARKKYNATSGSFVVMEKCAPTERRLLHAQIDLNATRDYYASRMHAVPVILVMSATRMMIVRILHINVIPQQKSAN
jgi:hypothetical protein